jgi:hypothetical protein
MDTTIPPHTDLQSPGPGDDQWRNQTTADNITSLGALLTSSSRIYNVSFWNKLIKLINVNRLSGNVNFTNSQWEPIQIMFLARYSSYYDISQSTNGTPSW